MTRRLLPIILIAALALRLGAALALDPLQPYAEVGGDMPWYLANAYALITDAPPGTAVNGYVTDISALGQPPVYFIIAGLPQLLFSPTTEIVVDSSFLSWHFEVNPVIPQAIFIVRIVQAVLSTVTCYFAYRMAFLLIKGDSGRSKTDPYSVDRRGRIAGLIAAAALAFSPVFILEASEVMTETVYIFFVAAGLWLYTEALGRENRRGVFLAGAGIMFGLATLTRAVFLLFPLALVVYLVVVRAGWRRAFLLLVVYLLVALTWTGYNLARWNRWVVAGTGLDAFIYVGATGWDDPEAVDQRLLAAQPTPEAPGEPILSQPDFTQAAGNAIMSDIPGYLRHRAGELAGAYLQPHGTLFFPGESLRQLALDWLRNDRSLNGLLTLTRGDSFWQKLLLYVLHFTALIFGVIGIWRSRRNWRLTLPLIGFIVYTTMIHLVLLALPRYLFPMTLFWWVFAAVGITKRGAEYRVLSAELKAQN